MEGMLRTDRKPVLKLYEELFLKRLKLKELRTEIQQERGGVGEIEARFATLLRVFWAQGTPPKKSEFEQLYEKLTKGRDHLGELQYSYDEEETEFNNLEAELDELEAPLFEMQQNHSKSEGNRAASMLGQTEEPSSPSTLTSNGSLQYQNESKLRQSTLTSYGSFPHQNESILREYQSCVGDGNISWERLQEKLHAYHKHMKFTNIRKLGTDHSEDLVHRRIEDLEADFLAEELALEDLTKKVKDLANQATKAGFAVHLPFWAVPRGLNKKSKNMTSARDVVRPRSVLGFQGSDLLPNSAVILQDSMESEQILETRRPDSKPTDGSYTQDVPWLGPVIEPGSPERQPVDVLPDQEMSTLESVLQPPRSGRTKIMLETDHILAREIPVQNLPELKPVLQHQALHTPLIEPSPLNTELKPNLVLQPRVREEQHVLDLDSISQLGQPGNGPEDTTTHQTQPELEKRLQLGSEVGSDFGNDIYSVQTRIKIWTLQQLEVSSLARARHMATLQGVWKDAIDKETLASCLQQWGILEDTAVDGNANKVQSLSKPFLALSKPKASSIVCIYWDILVQSAAKAVSKFDRKFSIQNEASRFVWLMLVSETVPRERSLFATLKYYRSNPYKSNEVELDMISVYESHSIC